MRTDISFDLLLLLDLLSANPSLSLLFDFLRSSRDPAGIRLLFRLDLGSSWKRMCAFLTSSGIPLIIHSWLRASFGVSLSFGSHRRIRSKKSKKALSYYGMISRSLRPKPGVSLTVFMSAVKLISSLKNL